LSTDYIYNFGIIFTMNNINQPIFVMKSSQVISDVRMWF